MNDDFSVNEERIIELTPDAAPSNRINAAKLGIFSLLNAVVLSVSVVTDQSPFRFTADSFLDKLLHDYWMIAETCLVFTAIYWIGRVLITLAGRPGFRIAVGLIAMMPVVWYCDRLARISLQDGLLSATAIKQLIAFAPFLDDYTTPETFTKIAISGGIFIAVEAGLFFVAGHLASSPPRSQELPPWLYRRTSITILSITGVLLLLWTLRSPTHAATIYRAHPQQHPLCMFGIVDLLMPPRTIIDQKDRERIESHLRQHRKSLERIESRYSQLRIDTGSPNLPDIVLIMAESLRHDAIALPHAPNLCEFRESSITSVEHYSGGNSTEYGMFTLLTGLDSALMDHGRHWPVAFPQLMKQAGYFTAFFGSGPYTWMGMSDFVRPEDWDVYHDEEDVFPYYKRDQGHVAQIVSLLNREEETREHGGPVCVFFCPYTTHWDYHFAAEDEVHKPSLQGNLWWPPDPNKDLRGLQNRYMNSIHALDRVIKPLLRTDHIVVFVGDHGEAMFDYGNQLVHANSLSPAQTRTPLIMSIPGVQPQSLKGPTQHCDILPTLIQAIGATVNHGEVFSGASLLATAPATRRFMLYNGKNKACGLFAPYASSGNELNLVQWSKLDLWNATVGEATVHEESGSFKQTLGGVKEPFLRDFDAWLEATLDDATLDNANE
tara:strand:+ start:28627 stop:30612 length:1986 start_codon:yes stop_codon:yes gene_type:complete